MSAERPQREVAHRLFAAEFEDAEYSYAESDEERAPNYVVTPTGARVNRLFVVGVLTEVEPVGENVLRARIVDPTGAFVVYAGQYQPEAASFFERAEPPAFVAVTGKARTFQPDDADVVYTSIRPESANEVAAETRDRWVVQTAEQTLDRVETCAAALERAERGDALESELARRGVSPSLAAGIPRAIDHYGTTPAYLAAIRRTALDAARVVANELDEVPEPSLAPDADGEPEYAFDAALPEPAVDAPDVETENETMEAADEESVVEGPDTDDDGDEDTADDDVEDSGAGTDEPAVDPGTETPDEETVDPDDEAVDSDDEAVDPDEMYELSEEEREEVKSEFGVGFETGNEVQEPGEANLDTPDPAAEDGADAPLDARESESERADEPASESGDDGDADGDLEDVVVETMAELDDGDGAPREELVQTVATEYDVSAADVEDAIQDALMGGRCYEPDDDRITPI